MPNQRPPSPEMKLSPSETAAVGCVSATTRAAGQLTTPIATTPASTATAPTRARPLILNLAIVHPSRSGRH